MKTSKLFIVFFLLLLITLNVFAGVVSKSNAYNIANDFFKNGLLRTVSSSSSVNLVYTAKDKNENPCFYVFNDSEEKKFVMISAEDKTKNILGYSDNSVFNLDSIPNEMKFLMNYYIVNISEISKDSTYSETSVSNNRSLSIVKPLLGENVYSQYSPFNDNCPLSGEKRCLVGCGALSMTQIMSYYKWPESSTGSVSYDYNLDGKTVNVSQSLEKSYDWDNIKDYYNNESTEVEKNAIAKLCYNFALACKMQFGINGSSSINVDVANALCSNFKYDSDLRAISRMAYSESGWNKIIRNELSDARPIEIFASSDDWGHAFVCDGYDNNDLFHINWGWGGLGNGYYDLSILSFKNTQDFNDDLIALVDIRKEDNISHLAVPYCDGGFISFNKSSSYNTVIYVKFGSLHFENILPKTCILGLGLYKDDSLIKDGVSSINLIGTPCMNMYYASFPASFTMPSNIADGDYKMTLVYKETLDGEWKKVYMTDSLKSVVNVIVANNKITCSISNEVKKVDVSIAGINTKLFYNNGQRRSLSVDIKNGGDEYYNDLSLKFVRVDDDSLKYPFPDTRLLIVPKGESETYLFTGIMDNIPEGEYYLALNYKDESVSVSDMQEKIYTNEKINVTHDNVSAPVFSIVSTDIKSDSYDKNDISISAKVRNTGGEYCGEMMLIFSSSRYKYIIASNYVNIDGEKVVSFKGAKSLANGSYNVTIAYMENSSSSSSFTNNVIGDAYSITIGDNSTILDDEVINKVDCLFDKVSESLIVICEKESIMKVVVYSITGNKMLEAEKQTRIPLSSLSSGVYLAEVFFNNGEKKRIKFIK